MISDFRACTEDDFSNNNYVYETLDELPMKLDKILCPETKGMEMFYRLTNSYIETINKDSFAIEIIKCNKEEKGEGFCENDDDIKELISKLVFT